MYRKARGTEHSRSEQKTKDAREKQTRPLHATMIAFAYQYVKSLISRIVDFVKALLELPGAVENEGDALLERVRSSCVCVR